MKIDKWPDLPYPSPPPPDCRVRIKGKAWPFNIKWWYSVIDVLIVTASISKLSHSCMAVYWSIWTSLLSLYNTDIMVQHYFLNRSSTMSNNFFKVWPRHYWYTQGSWFVLRDSPKMGISSLLGFRRQVLLLKTPRWWRMKVARATKKMQASEMPIIAPTDTKMTKTDIGNQLRIVNQVRFATFNMYLLHIIGVYRPTNNILFDNKMYITLNFFFQSLQTYTKGSLYHI